MIFRRLRQRADRLRVRLSALWRAERAGRAWRAHHSPAPLAPGARVTFLVPLIGRAAARDWRVVNARLAETLGALLAQTDPRWEAVICGQDRPEALPEDPRLRFLPFPEPVDPGAVTDKYRKIPHILSEIGRAPAADGYLFLLDADDILHPGLVAHMLTAAAPGGYLIDSGFMLNAATGDIARLRRRDAAHPRAAPFHLHCGSCSAIRADRLRWRDWWAPFAFRGRHQWQAETLRRFGLELAPVPFPAAVYVVNHGDNTRLRLGRMNAKVIYAEANRIGPEEAATVRSAFGLPPPGA